MALGKPSITTPRSLTLQAIQQAIQNISERFRQTDDVISQLAATGNASVNSVTATSLELRALIAALAIRVAALEAAGGAGGSAEITLTSTAALRSGDPVRYVAGDQCAPIDPDDLTMCAAFIGVSSADVSVGAQVAIKVIGEAFVNGAAFDVGFPVYASSGGGVTQDPAGNALMVGVATSVNKIGVGGTSGTVALRTPTMLSGASARDDYLPVTYALAKQLASASAALPVVTGEVPPVLVYLDDGSLVYVGV